jgi:hypothetical protein
MVQPMMKGLMQRVMLSCDRATALVEKAHEEKLSMKERMQLSMHTAMCKVCKDYKRMSEGIERFFQKWSERVQEEREGMPAAKKERLIEELRGRG